METSPFRISSMHDEEAGSAGMKFEPQKKIYPSMREANKRGLYFCCSDPLARRQKGSIMDEINDAHWGIDTRITSAVAVTTTRSTAIAFQFATLRKSSVRVLVLHITESTTSTKLTSHGCPTRYPWTRCIIGRVVIILTTRRLRKVK
jgi:hypothetical protein